MRLSQTQQQDLFSLLWVTREIPELKGMILTPDTIKPLVTKFAQEEKESFTINGVYHLAGGIPRRLQVYM